MFSLVYNSKETRVFQYNVIEIQSKIGTAWRNNGIILLKLDEISDEWLRAKLKDYMVKLYGESV